MDNKQLKIDFWKELWIDLINNFLKRSYGFNLYSPQILVEDIIIEIEENQFKNVDNKRYFSSKVNEYLENDEIIRTILKSDFSLLQKAIHNKKNGYVLSLCKQIKSTFNKGVYFNQTLKLVQDLVSSEEELDMEFVNKINFYSQSLIVDFIKKSYVLEDIEKFLENIFDTYDYYKTHKILNTNFPHEIDYNLYKNENDEFDRDSFEKAVKLKIDHLTLFDRINTLSYYYNKETEKAYYVFVIHGLKSDQVLDKTVLGVNFYSMHNMKFAKDGDDFFENLQFNTPKDRKYLQAVVEVDYLLAKSSSIIAKRKIETAIDILYCYFNIKTPITYAEFGYSVFNKNGKSLFSRGGGDKFPNDSKYHFDSLDLSEQGKESHLNDINKYDFLFNNRVKSETLSKIKNALRWHRKAEQSIREEDKILNYWIALENLFNTKEDIKVDILNNPKNSKVHLIQEIVSARQVFNYVYDYGWELYWYYRNKKYYQKDFPKELAEKAQLIPKANETIYLKKFIDNLEEIKSHESNLYIIDKINSVMRFYNDFDYTKSIIINHISNIKNDILMIYRLRNLIVHNAHYDNTLLPYYSWKAKTYCGGLLRKFIQEYDETKTLSSIIFDIYIGKEKYLLDFDNGQVNLFENED